MCLGKECLCEREAKGAIEQNVDHDFKASADTRTARSI